MANLTIDVIDANNLLVNVTPVSTQVIAVDTGLTGPRGPAGAGGALGYYGIFCNTATQNNVGYFGSANTIPYNTTIENSGVSIASSNQITFAVDGTFNIHFSGEFNSSNFVNSNGSVWIAKNGVDVANSNTQFSLAENGFNTSITTDWIFTVVAGDYLQIKWSGDDPSIVLIAFSAQTSPTRPVTPSSVITVQQVMNTQIGPTGPEGTITPEQVALLAATETASDIAQAALQRVDITGTTGALVSWDYSFLDISAFKTYTIQELAVSSAAWIRVYSSSAAREADQYRSIYIDAPINCGLILEVITTQPQTVPISPFVVGGDVSGLPTGTAFVNITNTGSNVSGITLTLQILRMEN